MISSKLSSTTVQVHSDDLGKRDIDGLFEEHKLILGNYADISFPIKFRQVYGKKLQDILDTGWPSLFLISEKMKAVLENNNLTGWKSYDIKVFDMLGLEIKGYFGFSVTGRCGPIDYSKSEIIEKRLVDKGPLVKYYRGLHVGLNEWDGSDFFLPEKYFGVIITQKAAETIKKSNLTNIRLENIAEIEMDDYTVQVAMRLAH